MVPEGWVVSQRPVSGRVPVTDIPKTKRPPPKERPSQTSNLCCGDQIVARPTRLVNPKGAARRLACLKITVNTPLGCG